jgi:hypothetical protein
MKTKFLLIALVVCLFSNAQAQVPSYVPTNGLVGWWPFNGNANDESGNGNNGTLNGPTLTADRFGNANKAYSFDGVNDYVNCGNGQILNQFSTNITVSAWVKSQPSASTDKNIISKYGCNPGGWSLETAQNTLVANFTGCTQNVTNQTNLNSGQWTHVIGVKEATNWKIFVNGVLNNTSSGTFNYDLNSGFNLIIGVQNDNFNPTTYWDGLIDDIGLWNRALTHQEITNLYNSSAYVPCASPAFPANLANGLVGYWPFCGDANDESGNGNNGTVNGATLTSDRFGNPNSAYDFDGSASYIEVLHSTSQNLTNAVSFSLWINPTDYNLNSQASRVPLGKKINATTSGLGFETLDGVGSCCGPQFYLNNNTGAGGLDYEDPVSLTAGSWTHLVGTYDGNTLKLYKNSILIGSATGSLSLSSTIQSLFFGREGSSSPNRYFKGLIDDIGFWNRALSASEIQQLYNTGIYFQTVTGSCDTLQFNANITGFNPVTYQNQVKVFPNPAKDNLVIDCGANFNTLTGYSMKILNTVGQSVYNSLITQQVTNIPLTAPTWSPGAYIVQFINPTGTVIEAKQIIIQ